MTARITFEHACSDCDTRGTHPTGPEAARAAAWHELTHPDHRALTAGWNGWTRPRKDWI
jgi:hypothetical protein